MKKYIEIKDYKHHNTIERYDVTGKSKKAIDKTEDGMNINLNHEEFYTIQIESEIELPSK